MKKELNHNTELATEYVQFSKKVTRWGMILVTLTLVACLSLITFFGLDAHKVTTVGQLYTTYITIMGITIGAYQGNSSLEKWTKARYKFEEIINKPSPLKEDEETIIEEE